MSKYELLQWKFTACQYNIEGSNGFNTFSMSKALTSDDKADLCHRAGAYTPPEGSPFAPAPEEMANRKLFPMVFSSFPLRSGKRAVVRTVYVGQDYAGLRWGNFFSHALVFPSDSIPFYPIQLFDSPLFADGLTEQERTTPNPGWLPTLVVEETTLRDFSSELSDFFRDPERLDALLPLLRAIRERGRSGKPLIVRDSQENVPFWIAAVQYAFPLRLAGGITFTTYVPSLSHGERFHLTMTSDGKTLQLDSPATRSTNHVFDFLGGTLPEIAAMPSGFLDEIKPQEPLYPGRDMRRDILPFIQKLHGAIGDDSLDKAVLLYKFLNWNTQLDGQTLLDVFDFCWKQDVAIKQDFVRKVFQKEEIFDVETLEMLLSRLVKIIREPGNNDSFRVFFVRQCENSVVEPFGWMDSNRRFKMIDRFLAAHDGIGKKLLEHVQGLIRQSSGRRKYVCLYYALVLCMCQREGFTDAIRFVPKLEKGEWEQFFYLALDFVVSKSVSAEIHQHTVGLFTKECGYDSNFSRRYLTFVRKYGGTDQWKYGRPAKEQGTSFAQYVLNDSSTEEWNMWLGETTPYHETWRGKGLLKSQMWLMFDINVPLQGAEKKKQWECILNVRKVLETLTVPKRRYKLKVMGLPTWWDIWGLNVIGWIAAVALAAVMGVAVFLTVSRKTSEVPVSQPSVKGSIAELPQLVLGPSDSNSTEPAEEPPVGFDQ